MCVCVCVCVCVCLRFRFYPNPNQNHFLPKKPIHLDRIGWMPIEVPSLSTRHFNPHCLANLSLDIACRSLKDPYS
jgi:hypothetical protein